MMLMVGWFGCVGFNGPLREYFSLYRAIVSDRETELIRERKISKQRPHPCSYCKYTRSLSFSNPSKWGVPALMLSSSITPRPDYILMLKKRPLNRGIGFFTYRVLPQSITNLSEDGRVCPCRLRYWRRHPVISNGHSLLMSVVTLRILAFYMATVCCQPALRLK